MTDTAKLIIAVLGVFAVGFFIVGTSEKSEEEKKSDAFVAAYSSMTKMANKKCPAAIKKHTGTAVFFPSSTDSDKESYITMTWEGGPKDNFKKAVCKFVRARGGIGELVIDDKVIIDK